MGKQSRARKEKRNAASKGTAAIELLIKHNVHIDPNTFPIDDLRDSRMNSALVSAADVIGPLDGERTNAALIKSAKRAEACLDAVLASIPLEVDFDNAGRQRVACKTGCNHCCTIRVTVSAPEVIRCAAYVRTELSDAEFKKLRTRIEAYIAESAILKAEDQVLKPRMCPLNVQGQCIAYEARPLACRSHHSFDVEACKQEAEYASLEGTIPSDPLRFEARMVHLAGIRAGYQSMSIDTPELEFVPALQIALNKENAGDMLLVGENVFAEAYKPDLIEVAEKDFRKRLSVIG